METETAVHKKEHHSPVGIFAYTLKIGKWNKLFRPVYYKTLIAEALNKTVCKGEFKNTIAGYLISNRRLCLVLKIEQKKTGQMLQIFYARVRDEIRKHLDTMDRPRLKSFLESEQVSFGDIAEGLFKEYELKNKPLIKLITGRKVELPYYDPQLKRLKDHIKDYPFCSAIDYLGGEGPVLVKVMRKKDWDELDNRSKKNSEK